MGYARDRVLCRISLVFVLVFLGLALLWADNYWVWFFAGAGVVAIILFLSQDVFKRSRGPSSDKQGNSAAALGLERKRVSSPLAEEHASLGPCSEEAEAALTNEAMLSLWYGGLNGIYARKCRAAGRWIGTPLNHMASMVFSTWIAFFSLIFLSFLYKGTSFSELVFMIKESFQYTGWWMLGFVASCALLLLVVWLDHKKHIQK